MATMHLESCYDDVVEMEMGSEVPPFETLFFGTQDASYILELASCRFFFIFAIFLQHMTQC